MVWYGMGSPLYIRGPYHTESMYHTKRLYHMIPNDKINQIKEAASILEVVSDFVELKKRGSVYVGLSPFSNERTPSFTVHPAKGIFKDFSSGKGGDVIEFLEKHLSIDYPTALTYLAKKYSIDIQSDVVYPYQRPERRKPIIVEPSFIHPDELLKSKGLYNSNNLFKFMVSIFGITKVLCVFDLYHIGSIENWVIFWQVDVNTFVRSGKLIKYLPNGHRDKESKTTWFHSKTKEYKPVYPNFNLVQCFFGEHLLTNDLRKPVAIVESEKTALICSLMMDKYIWLSCCMKNGLNDEKCQVLNGRSVTLFPDLGAYDEWAIKAKQFSWSISDCIEKHASEDDRKKGLDLADFLLR
jgi:hypothetical protein